MFCTFYQYNQNCFIFFVIFFKTAGIDPMNLPTTLESQPVYINLKTTDLGETGDGHTIEESDTQPIEPGSILLNGNDITLAIGDESTQFIGDGSSHALGDDSTNSIGDDSAHSVGDDTNHSMGHDSAQPIAVNRNEYIVLDSTEQSVLGVIRKPIMSGNAELSGLQHVQLDRSRYILSSDHHVDHGGR